jgi:hypothetical protein
MPTGVYPRKPLAERFWAKVDRRGPDECWPWLGSRHGDGYGEISVDGKLRPAHVVAYELKTGAKIPTGIDGCHKCDHPWCCNPDHVFPGTRAENMADCRAKGRDSKPPVHEGVDHHFAKLTVDDVREIRSTYIKGSKVHGASALARRFGLSHTAVQNLVDGRTWQGVG